MAAYLVTGNPGSGKTTVAAELVRRGCSATPANAGRNEAQRTQILEGRPVFEQEMRAVGAVVLDGRRPTAMLVDSILGAVSI